VQHAARVLALLRKLAERREHADVVERFAETVHQRDDQGALVERIEDVDRAHELQTVQLGALVRRCRRRRQCERLEPETLAGKLPVIGRG
jgi:hypothetical protein